jgi:hypothetical protein
MRKMHKVLFNMYNGIKSRALYNGEMSEYFPCNIGVRQGETFPLSYSQYLNDLQQLSFLKEGVYVAWFVYLMRSNQRPLVERIVGKIFHLVRQAPNLACRFLV